MPHIDTEEGTRITVRRIGSVLQLNIITPNYLGGLTNNLTRNEGLILQDLLAEQTQQMPWED
jgi:hypothetical protein